MIVVKPEYPTLTQVSKYLWKLEHPVTFRVDGHTTYEVPVGFHTDGASVPRIFWNMFPPMSNYTNAAVCHDWLYKEHAIDDRKKCDRVFLDAMKFLGVNAIKRSIMYRAVRMFGWAAWNAKR